MTAHVSTPAPSLADYCPTAPARLAKLVDAMLSKEPELRPQSPMEVAQQLLLLTAGSNLKQLVRQAERSEPVPTRRARPTLEPTLTTQPFFRRQVPLGLLIATALGALAIGFVLGVLIKIEYPDGTSAELRVPAGGRITMVPDEDEGRKDAVSASDAASSSDAASATASAASRKLAPLFFALLLDEQDPALAKLLQKADLSNEPAAIPNVYPLDESVNVFHIEVENKRYGAVEANPDARIEWEDIQGHMSANIVGTGRSNEKRISMMFDKELAEKMKRLSKANINRRLAVVFNNRIISAPIILDARLASKRSWTVDSQRKSVGT